jgi:mercuric ion binding protein
MNRSYVLTLLATGIAAAIGGAVALTVNADDTKTGLTTTVFKVDGMTCGGCEASIRIAVGKIDGVEKVTASNEEGRATVTYDAAQATVDDIEAAIEKIGYSDDVVDENGDEGSSRSAATSFHACPRCG